MRTIGPARDCLILARLPEGVEVDPAWIAAADGVVAPPGTSRRKGLLHAVEVADPADVAADADLLVLPPQEITHRPLIEAAAASGLPLAMCTQGATLKEITRAVGWHQLAFRSTQPGPSRGTIRLHGGGSLVVVHGGGNLRAMAKISAQTFTPVGYDDADAVAPLAVAAGAILVLRAADAGFPAWAKSVRAAEAALGDGAFPPASDHPRRPLVAASDLAAGTRLSNEHVAFGKPTHLATGFAAHEVESVVGRQLRVAVRAGEPFTEGTLTGAAPQPPEWFSPRPPRQKPN
jgi:sialic acid synthase SpsE